MRTVRRRYIVLQVALLLMQPAVMRGQAPADTISGFTAQMAMIPMRDGTHLHTYIYTPIGADQPLPILLERTPYGLAGAARMLRGSYRDLAEDGYIFAFQDIRGRYDSEGEFRMNRPLHDPRDAGGVDETTDTWDTIDFLVKQVPANNGKVGVLGVSYPGWLAAMAGINPHPALRAISPQAPMTDAWMGDDFFHNGAFRLSYGFEYTAEMELSNDGSVPVPIDRYDTFDWYLALGPLSNANAKVLHDRVTTWNNFTMHPTYDSHWQSRALPTYLSRLEVPTLTVGGWWDQEDFYGPLKTYATLEAHDSGAINFIVLGPWNHGGWTHGDGKTLGKIDFGSATGAYFRAQVQRPWFAHWLKDQGPLPVKEALVFESGSNRWRAFDSWPPRQATPKHLYFGPEGRLGWRAPPGGTRAAADSFVSDPAHPVPYRRRPIQLTYHPRGSDWFTWLVEDQRFVDGRPDVLTWQTEPLTEAVTIAGDIAAHLFASTTGTDADWVVKLIDVYPDSTSPDPRMGGYELMVASEILRGRYRKSFERPEPTVPNRIEEYVVGLHQQSYQFRKGHRIMVQIQSTWFPVYDRNPQTYVPNIFQARSSDYRRATHRVYRSGPRASYVSLPVLEGEMESQLGSKP